MRISIIIVTWNALPLVQRCLPSVVASEYDDLEIILADNCSTDGTARWVEETYPHVKVIRHPENWAFCRGNNEAVPHATGDILIFLNNDVEVDPGWLGPIVSTFRSDEKIGVVQPKLLQYSERTYFEYAGGCGGFLDRYGYPFTRGRLFFTLEEDRGQYDDAADIFWATGAAMAVRREVLEAAGLFDVHFYMHMEEIDLCWRIQQQGYKIRVEPRSVAYHIGGGSLPQGDPRKTYFNFRNSLLLLYKHSTPAEWRASFPVRVTLDLTAALRALIKGRREEAISILRALSDAHRMKGLYAAGRPKNSLSVRPPYRGSIVIDYFLRKRITFDELPSHRFDPPFRRDGTG